MFERKCNNWCFNKDVEVEVTAPGLSRKILTFCDEAMCVESTFKVGAIASMHHHPHTQLTYVAKGAFRYTIGEETYVVKAGDALLKQNSVVHGAEWIEEGILVDFFTPMREDFIK